MSGLFKSKKVTPEYVSTPQDDRINQLWKEISPLVSSLTSKTQGGYTQEKVAPLTNMENQNLGTLQNYLNSSYTKDNDLYQSARKTTQGLLDQDPWAEGGAINYTQNRLKKYLTNDLLPSTRRGSASTGSLYSSGAVKRESQNVEDVMGEMTQYAYNYQDQLNRLKASLIPQATSMSEFETNEPLNRLSNTMGLAGYQRTQYDQPKDTAEYNDYLNQLQQLQAYLSGSLQLSGTSGGAMAMPQYQPSIWSQYVQPTIQAGAQAVAAAA